MELEVFRILNSGRNRNDSRNPSLPLLQILALDELSFLVMPRYVLFFEANCMLTGCAQVGDYSFQPFRPGESHIRAT